MTHADHGILTLVNLGQDIEISTVDDDHSRFALPVTAYLVVTAQLVSAQCCTTDSKYAPPAATLVDNGLVFAARFRSRP